MPGAPIRKSTHRESRILFRHSIGTVSNAPRFVYVLKLFMILCVPGDTHTRQGGLLQQVAGNNGRGRMARSSWVEIKPGCCFMNSALSCHACTNDCSSACYPGR